MQVKLNLVIGDCPFHERQIELIDEPKETIKPKFKVGDKVSINSLNLLMDTLIVETVREDCENGLHRYDLSYEGECHPYPCLVNILEHNIRPNNTSKNIMDRMEEINRELEGHREHEKEQSQQDVMNATNINMMWERIVQLDELTKKIDKENIELKGRVKALELKFWDIPSFNFMHQGS